jgi:hypothetical protein
MMQVRMKSLGTDVTGPSPVALAEAPAGVPLRRSGLQGVAASRNAWVTTKQSCVALLTHLSLSLSLSAFGFLAPKTAQNLMI